MDGLIVGDEECDDNNSIDTDECSNLSRINVLSLPSDKYKSCSGNP